MPHLIMETIKAEIFDGPSQIKQLVNDPAFVNLMNELLQPLKNF